MKFKVFCIVGIVLSIAGVIYGLTEIFSGYMDGFIVMILVSFGVSLIASICGLILDYLEKKAEREEKQYAQKIEQIFSYPEWEDEEDDTPKEAKIDALRYMGLNLENINGYYIWSQKQAKSAFALAVAMCIAGFALLVIAIFLASESSVSAAVITAVGGVVTELIAGTALFVYRKSLAQLNHYHKALHEDERFLSSVNLLDRFSTKELQDQMLQEIIRSEIQMNIAEAGWEEDEKSGKKKEEHDDGGNH